MNEKLLTQHHVPQAPCLHIHDLAYNPIEFYLDRYKGVSVLPLYTSDLCDLSSGKIQKHVHRTHTRWRAYTRSSNRMSDENFSLLMRTEREHDDGTHSERSLLLHSTHRTSDASNESQTKSVKKEMLLFVWLKHTTKHSHWLHCTASDFVCFVFFFLLFFRSSFFVVVLRSRFVHRCRSVENEMPDHQTI